MNNYLINQQEIKSEQFNARLLSSPQYDGMPKASYGNNQEKKTIKSIDKIREYEQQCKLIEDVVTEIGKIDDDSQIYSNLLNYIYIKGYSIVKTRHLLSDNNYEEFIPESTYFYYHKEALLKFANLLKLDKKV